MEKEKGGMKNKYLFWSLVAIELFMSFSFLGYIHIEPISLTFVYIPVLAAGCVLGAKEAAAVGAVFGLASMWKASAFYVAAGDAVFFSCHERKTGGKRDPQRGDESAVRLPGGASVSGCGAGEGTRWPA